MPEKKRQQLWAIFDKTRQALRQAGLFTKADLFSQLAEKIATLKKPPFDYAIVDEAQDVSIPQLKFLAALGNTRANALFFAGDLGQRIFQQPFSWKALGIDIRGRSKTLRINYRTSHQIRKQADRLLGPEVTDVDGNKEDRRNAISVFNGPDPQIKVLNTIEDEQALISQWLKDQVEKKVRPHEIGLFVRSSDQMEPGKSGSECCRAQNTSFG